MAGIGFEIRKILKRKSLLSAFEAYGYAGIIGSGPWVLSIVAMTVVGLMSIQTINTSARVIEFLVSVTYMMAGSLVLTGGLQLMFTRYVSDQLFLKQDTKILPNLFGSIIVVNIVGAVVAIIGLAFIKTNSVLSNALMFGSFVCLCSLWLLLIFLSGLRQFKQIVVVMAQGYGLLIALSWYLKQYGSEGLLAAFFISQVYLLFAFLYFVLRDFRTDTMLSFDFLKPDRVFYSLFLCGTLYNLGVWADKFIFWFTPYTSEPVLGWMRASIIYDVPIFLAYLSIIPGMAVFLVRIETDFSEQHERYYNAVRGTATLEKLIQIKAEMNNTVRRGMGEIIKVQGAVIALLILWGKPLLEAIGIDPVYHGLLSIDLVGVGFQVLLLSILNVMFYFDKRAIAVVITAVFCGCNIVFTGLSIMAGPQFYGFGFAGAALVATVIGFYYLDDVFKNLEYHTYMLQP